MVVRVLALAACGLAACTFDPQFGDGELACSDDGRCPAGYTCSIDGRCYLGGGPYRPGAIGGGIIDAGDGIDDVASGGEAPITGSLGSVGRFPGGRSDGAAATDGSTLTGSDGGTGGRRDAATGGGSDGGACGGAGQRCCSAGQRPCSKPLNCDSAGLCSTCGGDGQPCCAGKRCPSSTQHLCVNALCR